MTEQENNSSTQKPKAELYQPAVISVLLGLLAFIVIMRFPWGWECFFLGKVMFSFFASFALVGFVVGVISDHRIYKSKGKLKGRLFSMSGTGLCLVFLIIAFLFPSCPPDDSEYQLICSINNMKGIGASIYLYASEFDDEYPTPDKWCDLMMEHVDVGERAFICPSAKKSGSEEKSHYAINPKAEPNSPNDVVLLFETKGGWNQYGGKELLTTENHENGCNIVFNDGSAKFIKTEDVNSLRWE